MRRAALVVAVAAAACSGSSSAPVAVPSPSPSPLTGPSSAPSPSPLAPSPSPSASPAVVSPSPAAAAAVPFCTSGQLRLSIGPQEGAAGTMYQLLVLTNQGATCSLRGFPGLSFLDAAGRQVGSPAAMSSAPRRRVLLRPGGSATAQLAIRTARNYPDSDCAPRPATRLRVYPPGQRVPLTAADPADVCSVRTARQLTVGPVSPG